MACYIDSKNKCDCFGCEACKQICPKGAIKIVTDTEGFNYPLVDDKKCINCNLCRKVCPFTNSPEKYSKTKMVYGGYNKDWQVRDKSTSGGIFTSIVEAYCNNNYIIFGAASKGLKVYHTYINDKNEIDLFRKSKYSQSEIGNSYKEVKEFLNKGKKVLFSGTPCQVAGLRTYLLTSKANLDKLLTVEVICEGVPSPLYGEKFNNYLLKKYKSSISKIDYRYKDSRSIIGKKYAKWDFQVMKIELENGRSIKKDRWFNPFWKLWLEHLMSRPSCYSCPFAVKERLADITLGDLWGVHLYCPELYGKNAGSSLILCNTDKGMKVFKDAIHSIYGHELKLDDAIKYQSPLRKSIAINDKREEFMKDLKSDMTYLEIIRKWYKKPKFKLLFSKYVWGNRQKIFLWNIKNRGSRNEKND